ncbi:TetR/AcrR family transcriptional regulator [Lysobacter cavernae]|uniref:TetR/AcrR family transcriptional regulator n=1 Tax=Lysobacter cavernae TaxID=1685901 RepID=A0ABV7RNK9_9GAMM
MVGGGFVYAVHMPSPLPTADRILRAARTLFERDGVQAVTMRRVADAVGITPMAIYRHFGNREALLKRISDDSFDTISRHWLARNQGGDALSRVIALQRIYLDYALAHPHLFDHAFSMRRADARRYPQDFHAGLSPTLTVAADAVADAMQAGQLRQDDAWDVAMTLWAHTHGLIALYRAGRFSYDDTQFRQLYDASLQRLLQGLKAS